MIVPHIAEDRLAMAEHYGEWAADGIRGAANATDAKDFDTCAWHAHYYARLAGRMALDVLASRCGDEPDPYREAVAILEGRTLKLPTRAHLEAVARRHMPLVRVAPRRGQR